VPAYKFTPYLENEVLRKRPYLTKEMCIRVIESPIRSEAQEQDRPASPIDQSAGSPSFFYYIASPSVSFVLKGLSGFAGCGDIGFGPGSVSWAAATCEW